MDAARQIRPLRAARQIRPLLYMDHFAILKRASFLKMPSYDGVPIMKSSFATLVSIGSLLVLSNGCGSNQVDVVDLNKVVDALVAVLDEGAAAKVSAATTPEGAIPVDGTVGLAATDGNAEVTSDAEIQAIDPTKQDPTKESDFLAKYAAKLNEMKVMSSPVGVSMTAGGEIVGFKDSNNNTVQDMGETKEFSVTIDPENKRLVASDNNGYHRPYGFQPGGMMMGYMLGSMLGRQNSHYSGAASGARPSFNNTPMSPSNYHSSAVSSVRSRVPSSSSGARARTGSKGFSFGK